MQEEKPISSFAQLELSIYSKGVEFVFLLNGTRFYVSITSEMLKGGGGELLRSSTTSRMTLTILKR